MSLSFNDAIKTRRTVYALGKKLPISDESVEELIKEALTHAPSAFNSESGRIVLLLGEKHDAFWDATKEILRPLVPPANFGQTEQKLAAFKAAHGTILFFEDQSVIQGLQEKFALFKDNFPIWSDNSTGILQYVVWTSLATQGIGASLQHYNPLVDEWVRANTGIPASWKLTGEMPFGEIIAPAGPKESSPLEGRFKVRK